MLKKISLVLGFIVLAFCVVVAMQPSKFRIERSQKMAAPAYVAFNVVNSFKRWPTWSPWEKLDPNMKKSHSGTDGSVGSVYEWSGNDDVGSGRMTLTKTTPGESIVILLEFLKPWEATNTTTFAFTPAADGVNVTWAMDGENNFMAKAASLFMDMDALVGKDFEAGLATLKKVAEADAREIEKAKAQKSAQPAP